MFLEIKGNSLSLTVTRTNTRKMAIQVQAQAQARAQAPQLVDALRKFFSGIFDLFRYFLTFLGLWWTKGAGIGKFTQKGFFSSEKFQKIIIKVPENRTPKFTFFRKF